MKVDSVTVEASCLEVLTGALKAQYRTWLEVPSQSEKLRLLVIQKYYLRAPGYAVGIVLIEPKGQMFLVNIVVGGTSGKGRWIDDLGTQSHFLNEIKQIILGAGKAAYAGSGEADDHALDSTSEKCTVCHKSVSEGDLIVECPSCGGKAHKTHMLEWLHTRGSCPSCRVRLTESSLVPV